MLQWKPSSGLPDRPFIFSQDPCIFPKSPHFRALHLALFPLPLPNPCIIFGGPPGRSPVLLRPSENNTFSPVRKRHPGAPPVGFIPPLASDALPGRKRKNPGSRSPKDFFGNRGCRVANENVRYLASTSRPFRLRAFHPAWQARPQASPPPRPPWSGAARRWRRRSAGQNGPPWWGR